MGGNLQFGPDKITGKRIQAVEYEKVCDDVRSKLDKIFNKTHMLLAYRNKKSFGDLDVLVSEPINTYTSWKKQVKKVLDATFDSSNGDTCSYLVDGFQIDVKIVKPKYWETSKFFGDYSPMGNLIGRLARYLGLNFGHKGLIYRIYSENQQNRLDEVIICQNPREICNFFGLDYSMVENDEFEEETNIFDWIMESCFYSVEPFLFENLRHSDRTRNRKRPDYCRFLKYAQEKGGSKYEFLPKEDRPLYVRMISEWFDIDLQRKIDKVREEYQKDLAIYEKFNGHIVIELIGETGARFGKILGDFKKTQEDWKKFLEKNSSFKIQKIFLDWWIENKHKYKNEYSQIS